MGEVAPKRQLGRCGRVEGREKQVDDKVCQKRTGENMKKRYPVFLQSTFNFSPTYNCRLCLLLPSVSARSGRIIPKPDGRRFTSSFSSRQQLPPSQIAILRPLSLSSSSQLTPFRPFRILMGKGGGGCAFSSIHVSQLFFSPPRILAACQENTFASFYFFSAAQCPTGSSSVSVRLRGIFSSSSEVEMYLN